MPVAAYYLHDPAAPKPNSPPRMGTNVLLECRGRLLLEQRWDCGAWGLPGGRLRRGEDEAHGIARELFEETGLRLPEAAFTRVRVLDDADRIASYQDGTVWRMVIVLFRAQLPQEPELHCSRESCTLRFFTPEERRTADLVPTHRDLSEAWRPAPLEVAAAMLTRGQTVLLCRRPEGKARALQWEFPGGKLEPGESPDACLGREVKEETGFTLHGWRFRGVVSFLSDIYEAEQMFLFTSEDFSGVLHECDEGELAWVEKEKVPGLPLWEGDRVFLRLLAQDAPPFLLTLRYEGQRLVQAVLDGVPLPRI